MSLYPPLIIRNNVRFMRDIVVITENEECPFIRPAAFLFGPIKWLAIKRFLLHTLFIYC
jgi:hypothetical protein